MMDQNSTEKIRTAHPKLRAIMLSCYCKAVLATPDNVHPVIEQVYRSFEESDHDYQLGRTIKNPDGVSASRPMGQIISNAPGGHSWHNYGLALDFHLQINGKPYWPANEVEAAKNENWMIVVNIFKNSGFNWGGEFPGGFKDSPHLEHKMGQTIKGLLALHQQGKLIPGTPYVNF